MMLIKQGVDISRLNREIRRGLGIVENIYNGYDEELIITSTYEGNHSAGSLHYGNDAFDNSLPFSFTGKTIREIRSALGTDYDVVPKCDHLHIEYDPKGS